jgi:hypothetical protein
MKIIVVVLGGLMVMWSVGTMTDRHPQNTGKAILEALPHVGTN